MPTSNFSKKKKHKKQQNPHPVLKKKKKKLLKETREKIYYVQRNKYQNDTYFSSETLKGRGLKKLSTLNSIFSKNIF